MSQNCPCRKSTATLKIWADNYLRKNKNDKYLFTKLILMQNQAYISLLLTIFPRLVTTLRLSSFMRMPLSHHFWENLFSSGLLKIRNIKPNPLLLGLGPKTHKHRTIVKISKNLPIFTVIYLAIGMRLQTRRDQRNYEWVDSSLCCLAYQWTSLSQGTMLFTLLHCLSLPSSSEMEPELELPCSYSEERKNDREGDVGLGRKQSNYRGTVPGWPEPSRKT